MKMFKDYKDYFEFENEMLEDSKANLIQRLWFALKQRDEANSCANESEMMFCKDKDRQIEDRKLFVKNLGKLLAQTRQDIIACDLEVSEHGTEIATIYYKNGFEKNVNVSMDSYTAIIRDIAKHCD